MTRSEAAILKRITLSVEQVALRQLESAVWMYAYDFDEAAVHTIASAAYELLTNRLNLGDFESQFTKNIPNDEKKVFWAKFNAPYNFFKHGQHHQKDVESLEYDVESVELILLGACYANLQMPTARRLNCATAFMVYQMVKMPNFFEDSGYKSEVLKLRQQAIKNNINFQDRNLLKIALGRIKGPFIV